MHTFVVILWGPRKRQYLTAYATVGLTWLFLVLFIAISVSLHTHGSNVYENPDGVSLPRALLNLISNSCLQTVLVLDRESL
jgi:hypothetical protein